MSSFGFSDARKKKDAGTGGAPTERPALELGRFKPKQGQPAVDEAILAETDKVAEKTGFPSREASHSSSPSDETQEQGSLRRKRRPKAKIKGQLNIQGPKDTLEKFIDFCDAAELSYWEGIEQLLEKAKVSK